MNVLKHKGLIEGEQWYALQFTGENSIGGNLNQFENFFRKMFVSFKIIISVDEVLEETFYNIEAEVEKHPLSCEWDINVNDYVFFYKLHDYWDMDVWDNKLAVRFFNIDESKEGE